MTTGATVARPGTWRWHRRTASPLLRVAIYLVVIAGSIVFMFPFVWALMSSGKDLSEIATFPPTFWPHNPIFAENYRRIWTEAPFLRWLQNSVVITTLNLIGAIGSASLVAYSFARFEYPGRNVWFTIMLATMMLPGEVTLIPSYLIFQTLGWVNSIKPLVVPAWFGGGAFNVFLLRQFYLAIPRDLDEAAEIDGAKIMLPLSKPAIATAAALGFVYNWNNFMGPLIYLNEEEKWTAVVGLRYFSESVIKGGGQHYKGPPKENLLMGASIIVALPCLILFFVAQKYFVQGIVTTGLKG